MREKSAAAVLFAVALLVGAAPAATAGPALPLPLPVAGVESLITEGVSVEGPLVNNITLPALR
ncbi:hypothetical protein ACH4C6_25590 [Streptomyces sp. NPDC017943]|uniref:hypothetical protein n=1 Tax=Streptomyces sp. NPDC017943 TaxID=3365019 RepID=UPI0037988EC2